MKITTLKNQLSRQQMSNEVRSIDPAEAQYPAVHRKHFIIEKEQPVVPYNKFTYRERLEGEIPPPLFTKSGSLTDAAKARS